MDGITEDLTLEGIGELLQETILPFYKGFATDNTPHFRKSLTKEETSNVLETLHNVVVAIRVQTLKGEK